MRRFFYLIRLNDSGTMTHLGIDLYRSPHFDTAEAAADYRAARRGLREFEVWVQRPDGSLCRVPGLPSRGFKSRGGVQLPARS